MNYKGVSGRERKLLDELSRRRLTIFRPIDVSNILSESRDNTYRILSRMEDKDLITRIEKGKYISSKELEGTDIYETATHIIEPSYLSLWSGLHKYGYTTQIPRTVFVMTAIPKDDMMLQGQKIKFIKTKHFFGYTSDNKLVIAEPEKLLIDCILFPHYSGGFKEIKSSFEKADVDEKKIVEYALKIDNRSLNSRLGYIMEKTHPDADLELLNKNISTSPIPLDPKKEEGKMNKRWNIIDNVRL